MDLNTITEYLDSGNSTITISTSIIFSIIGIVGLWKVFKRAGKEGWEAIIPFYCHYVLYKITWGNGWLFLLTLIPGGGAIANCFTRYRLGKQFGKSTGFCIGLILLPWLFLLLMGMEKEEWQEYTYTDMNGMPAKGVYSANGYRGPSDVEKKTMIIVSAVLGVIYTIIMAMIIALSVYLISEGLDNAKNRGSYEWLEEEYGFLDDDMSYLDDYTEDELLEDVIPEEKTEENDTENDLPFDLPIGTYKDMEALAEDLASTLTEDMQDDSYAVQITGKANVLYLNMTMTDEIPDMAVSTMISMMEDTLDEAMQPLINDLGDKVACEDPTLELNICNNDGSTLWSKQYHAE